MKHPEYNMYDRLLLDKINIKKGTVTINGREYRLKDSNFHTINSENPYQLTTEELEVISKLKTSFMQSQRLAKHVNFLYSKGGMYKIYNNNLLFHGCIPMTEDGNLKKVGIFGKQLKGKELFDTIEQIAHRAYSLQDKSKTNESDIDSMWLFWCSPDSPLFGKNKAAVFERYFLDDEETHIEINDFYYMHRENEKTVHKLLENFGINNPEAKIINGHIESKKEDVNPIKANGKLIVISGGLTEKYRKGKNHSRYILTYNSYGLLLTEVEKFDNKAEAVSSGIDIKSEIRLKEEIKTRKLVSDTDIGNNIRNEIKDLKMLLMSYREGIIKEQI